MITAAELLAEIGDCRDRYPTADALAADAGMSPVAIESGKRKVAAFRFGCDKRLRDAFGVLADTTRRWHPWAGDHYARAIQRGHDHPRAIRTLGRAWCRVLWRCWQDRAAYDPPNIAACSNTSRSPFPARRGPAPTSLLPSGWPAPPSPNRRPAGPSAKRLTASRHPLTRGGLTQDVCIAGAEGQPWPCRSAWMPAFRRSRELRRLDRATFIPTKQRCRSRVLLLA